MTRVPTHIDIETAKPTTRLDLPAGKPLAQPELDVRLREASVRPATVTGDGSRPSTGQRDARHEIEGLLARLGLARAADGSLALKDELSLAALPGLSAQGPTALAGVLPGLKSIAATAPVPLAPEVKNPQALAAFADGMGRGLDDLFNQAAGQPNFLDSLAADSLTAAFMRLNIQNPLDTTAMQQQLEQALSTMRALAIETVQKQLQVLHEKLKEALASAMKSFLGAAIMAAIIAAIVVAIVASIVAAVVVAVVIMVVAMMVKEQIKAMAEKKIDEVKAEAQRQAEAAIRQIDQAIDAERQRRLQEIAAMSLVGPDGQPLTDESLQGLLKPRLVNALMQVTAILDARGPEAAAEEGPQIIHDAMYDELLALGIPPEMADGMAWQITLETMNNLATKLGQPASPEAPPDEQTSPPDSGRHPGDVVAPVSAEPEADDPGAEPASVTPPDTGRHPSDAAGAMTAAGATLGGPALALVDELQRALSSRVPPGTVDRLGEALTSRGVDATLREEMLREPSLAPFALLGLVAVVDGGVDAERLHTGELMQELSLAKDRALTALVEVGSESRRAVERLNQPYSI